MDVGDSPLNAIIVDFDTHFGHYIIAAAVLISALLWIFSNHDTGLRKLAAVAFGSSVALAAWVLIAHVFPAGPIPPGAMP